MISPVLRNLARQRVRSALTILGIAIGMMALVVVGALSQQLARIVQRSETLQGVVLAFVQQSAVARLKTRRHELETRLLHTEGVVKVVPEVVLPFDFGPGEPDRFGPPRLIFGLPDVGSQLLRDTLVMRAGSGDWRKEARSVGVGSDFANSEDAGVGSIISLYGSSYSVGAVYDQSFTIFDAGVIVPLHEGQRMLRQALPANLTPATKAADLATDFILVLRKGTDPALVAGRVNFIEGLHASDPRRLNAGLEATSRIFRSIVFGAALIALIIGSLSIVNTMTTAVRERTREIGIRKAIGATDGAIVAEVLLESAVVGGLGGLAGLAAALIFCAAFNAHTASQGSLQLFYVTPGLALGAFLFSVALGAVSGLPPAWTAARLNPTEALRRL
ncbi:MAG: ABC transporter permease [Candidatus Eremiobacter antarcticus]|nr:ABC transporter permease [Candidatus Eremiobacteraeota bacterium]